MVRPAFSRCLVFAFGSCPLPRCLCDTELQPRTTLAGDVYMRAAAPHSSESHRQRCRCIPRRWHRSDPSRRLMCAVLCCDMSGVQGSTE